MVETNELDIIPMKAMTAPKKALLRIPMTLTKALEIGDKKNVSATCREPTHAETVKTQRKCFSTTIKNLKCFFAYTPNLKERFSSPELSNFLFNATKTIPKMFNFLKIFLPSLYRLDKFSIKHLDHLIVQIQFYRMYRVK